MSSCIYLDEIVGIHICDNLFFITHICRKFNASVKVSICIFYLGEGCVNTCVGHYFFSMYVTICAYCIYMCCIYVFLVLNM